ncbi:MAG TPA: hypothetical protein VHC04_04680 [Rhodopila sp.]|nr:hypothetical protein [Rhodopila sp.]
MGTAAGAVAVLFLFVALTDPWDTLPLHWPASRVPVTGNQRFSYPALARSPRFDSAVIGTSTSRLLRPALLDTAFDARFVNLAMNDATVFEAHAIFNEFLAAHPAPKVLIVGLDVRWCVTGDSYQTLTPRPFPEWMYGHSRWLGYANLLNLFAVQEAGKAFGVLTGIKEPDMGSDGYTRFVPPDSDYDRARAQRKLAEYGVSIPDGARHGPPSAWRYPTQEVLRDMLNRLPAETLKILYFVPYNQRMLPAPGDPVATVWAECKRRAAALTKTVPNTVVVDFLRHSPITDDDDHYWDGMHTTVATADRVASDLKDAVRGERGPDYRLLSADETP